MGNFLTVSQTSHNPLNSLLRGRWDEIGRLRICATAEGGGWGGGWCTGNAASSVTTSVAVGRLRVWVLMKHL